jgi:hypothetical protein
MVQGCYTLADGRDPVVRVYCPDCHRLAQFRRAGLIERFGPRHPMPDAAADPEAVRDRQRHVWGAVPALLLTSERQAAAVARGGLPAAWQVDWHSRRD